MSAAQVVTTIHWPAAAVLATFMVVWSAVVLWAVKWLLERFARGIEQKLGDGQAEVHELREELHGLQVALPREYVRREDWIRYGGILDAKIDHLHTKLDALRERVYEH